MRSVDRLDTCVRPQRAGTGGPSGGGPWTYLIAARAAAPVARNAPAELPIGMITYGTRPSGGTDATHTFAGALQEAPASRIACASATVTEPNLGFSTMSRYSYVVLPAEADLARLAESLPDRYGDVTAAELAEARLTPHVQPLTESIIGDVRAAILLLLLTAVFVLLIAVANVLNLVLVRTEPQRRARLAACRVRSPSFRSNVVAFDVALPVRQYQSYTAAAAFHDQLREELLRVPGVEAVAAISTLPLTPLPNWFDVPVAAVGAPARIGDAPPIASARIVTPDFFATLRIPLLHGRTFQASDLADDHTGAILAESLARRLVGDVDPTGRRIELTNAPATRTYTVVGVVGDVRDASLTTPAAPLLCMPSLGDARVTTGAAPISFYPRELTFVVRSELPLTTLLPSFRAALRGCCSPPRSPRYSSRSTRTSRTSTSSYRCSCSASRCSRAPARQGARRRRSPCGRSARRAAGVGRLGPARVASPPAGTARAPPAGTPR